MNDAHIAAKLVYSGVLVGGGLYDATPDEDTFVNSNVTNGPPRMTWAKWKDEGGKWNFTGGIKTGMKFHDWKKQVGFYWSDFEWLAKHLKTCNHNDCQVKVFYKGGTYDTYDMPGASAGFDKGKHMMVFNTKEDIVLTKTRDGKRFGPTVLAPFSNVTLKGNAGFIDGPVIARTFFSDGKELEMHGDCYRGELDCSEFPNVDLSHNETNQTGS